MAQRLYLLGIVVVFGTIGVLGFFPSLVWPVDGALTWRLSGPAWISNDYGLLFGLLPVNFVHDVVYLCIAALALAGAIISVLSRPITRTIAVVVGLMLLGGLIWQTSRLFGLMPLHSYNVPLHLCTTILAIYFGWVNDLKDEQVITYGWVNGEEPIASPHNH